jgi:hypothetical protein
LTREAKISGDGKISGSVAAAAVAGAIFSICIFLFAGPSWELALYRLVSDGWILVAWLIACAGFGWIVWKILDGDEWGLVTSAAAGMGVISLLVLGLGLPGWLNHTSSIGILLLGIGIAIGPGRKWMRKGTESRAGNWAFVALAPLAGMIFVAAMFPPGFLWGADDPNGYDVVEYHLQVPREWFEAGKIFPLDHNVFSYFPFNVEMHYLLAMHLCSGPWSGMYLAQLMHGAMCGLTVLAVWTICGRGWRGTAAAVLTAAVPWVPLLASVAYDEGGMLLWGTLAVGWAMRARNLKQIALAGIFAGLAAGAKLTAVPVLFVGIPLALLITQCSVRTLGRCAVFGACGLLAASPWLIRNQVWAHNPIFPEGMKWLGQAHFSDVQVERWHLAHEVPNAEHRSVGGRLAAFGSEVLGDSRFGYVLIPLAVAAVVVSRKRQVAFLAIVLGVQILFWIFFTHVQGRFMVMAIPLAALLIGQMEGEAWKIAGGLAAAIVAGLGTTLVGLKLGGIIHRYPDLRELLGRENLNGLLIDTRTLPPDEPVDLVGDAKAFLYPLPMTRLHYKTVFDVDTSDASKSIIDDWLAGMPQTPIVIVNSDELARFAKTYYRIPSLSPETASSR